MFKALNWRHTWMTWSNRVMVSLSRPTVSTVPVCLSEGAPRSAFLASKSLSSSLGLFVLVGLVRGEVAGEAFTGGGREY